MKKNLFVVFACIGLFSCSDTIYEAKEQTYEAEEEQVSVTPGVYNIDVLLQPESGNKAEGRALDVTNGTFTNVYPYDYIYLHKADNLEVGHESLYVPLVNSDCIDCEKAIQLEVRVNEDESYDVRVKGQDTPVLKVKAGDEVYFSSIPNAYWTASILDGQSIPVQREFLPSPIDPNLDKTTTVLAQTSASSGGSENSGEVLKSVTYTCEQLIALQNDPEILLTRHCTGFRVYFMFSKVLVAGGNSSIDEYGIEWKEILGVSTTNFSIKMYFGPNFATKYDVLNNTVAYDDPGGYYSTMFQDDDKTNEYQKFRYVNYSYTPGDSDTPVSNGGFGYRTEPANYLLSPLNTHMNASDFGFYVFVKFSRDENVNLTNDEEGVVRWFRVNAVIDNLDVNRIHYLIYAYDLHDLKALIDAYDSGETNTMATTGARSAEELINIPQLELTPIKVIAN